MAEKFYRIAIQNGERLESAIKDLATVMHQQGIDNTLLKSLKTSIKGKTNEACEFLQRNRPSYKGDLAKYDNLLNNLKKQVVLKFLSSITYLACSFWKLLK